MKRVSSAVFSLDSDLNLTVVQRSNTCILLRDQNKTTFVFQGNSHYFIKLSDKNAKVALTHILHSGGLAMSAVHNLNHMYIQI